MHCVQAGPLVLRYSKVTLGVCVCVLSVGVQVVTVEESDEKLRVCSKNWSNWLESGGTKCNNLQETTVQTFLCKQVSIAFALIKVFA